MKNCENVLREYAHRLNDEDLKYLVFRYSQLLSGDRAEISQFVSQNWDIDKWLQTATTSTEFFDMLDLIGEAVFKEHTARSV